jgi:protein-tyrosine-phosphatase
MGCGDECPNVRALRREDWKIPDPKDLSEPEFREVRDQIENRVIKTLRELRVTGHLRSSL